MSHAQHYQGVAQKLKAKPAIFSFESDPQLASLVFCLGLQAEMGQPHIDRLSTPLGVDLNSKYPWQSELVSFQGMVGIKLWKDDVGEFLPRHLDFREILHPASLVEGKLKQLVFFPSDIARKYKLKNFELVVVRDWALSSILSEAHKKVNYLVANEWEIKNNTALQQADLMVNGQLAFSGTHDMTDHLLGGDRSEFDRQRPLFLKVQNKFNEVFAASKNPRNVDLLISYALGVVLDDLAQPKWYGSKLHGILVQQLLAAFDDTDEIADCVLPSSFHHLIASLRLNDPSLLQTHFVGFFNEISRNRIN